MNKEKIKVYLEQLIIRTNLGLLSLKYNFPLFDLVENILAGRIELELTVDFLVDEYGFENVVAEELVDLLATDIVEPYANFDLSQVRLAEEQKSGSFPTNSQSKTKLGETDWQTFVARDNIQKMQADLYKMSDNQIVGIIDYLWSGLGLGKQEEVIVILTYLAKENKMKVLWSDQRFKGILRNYLNNKYSAKKAEQYLAVGIGPSLMSLGLRLLLEEKLAIRSAMAAMLAIVIVDYLPTEQRVQNILVAYADSKDGKFHWNDINETELGLQLAV
ncbi:MAG: hypothetical protein CO073_00035 [Candidatus Komeilibacteria bacterium CG_4_9_14_0_8_um_filter_36_9]|uniref:Uncharacterized protein n=2 Tax=Candidatus Komeiliibacteriota TaxID=1817908 RepID=A0A2M8DSJ6_9BACT|nr:MAG: hypothetical protein COY67_00355 [Candidatus Komeilibacteria bacterium CG_4_10_14_0_8_um_filter_37_78]PJC02334.1 MAG: hypothetical protein CO073_00035 [Candidatus Komeilibacteria bacterium CG_4_9_14_0_8_um_filter_36_9]